MINVDFPGSNTDIAKNQPQYNPLRAMQFPNDPFGVIVTAFELSDEEIQEIVKTKRLYHSQLTFGDKMQPILMATNLETITESIASL